MSPIGCSTGLHALAGPVRAAGLIAVVALHAGACDSATAPPEEPEFGGLTVSVGDIGAAPDPNGFSVVVDGDTVGTVLPDRRLILGRVPVGTKTVELADIADNCEVVGENPRSVEVRPDSVTDTAFLASCAPPDRTLGALEIRTVTTGRDGDPDGYTVRIGHGDIDGVPANGIITVPNLVAADTELELVGVAGNCGVLGDHPRPVTIPAGDTVAIRLDVVCGAGRALAFHGGQVAELSPTATPELGARWTLELWLRADGALGRQILVEQAGAVSFRLERVSRDTVSFSYRIDYPEGDVVSGHYCPIVVGRWRHVALVHDDGAVTLRVDGEGCHERPADPDRISTAPSDSALTVGAASGGGDTVETPLTGRLDEVRIWGAARSAEELRSWRGRLPPPGTAGLLARWSFDDGEDPGADASGNGRHLVLGFAPGEDGADPTPASPGRP